MRVSYLLKAIEKNQYKIVKYNSYMVKIKANPGNIGYFGDILPFITHYAHNTKYPLDYLKCTS